MYGLMMANLEGRAKQDIQDPVMDLPRYWKDSDSVLAQLLAIKGLDSHLVGGERFI